MKKIKNNILENICSLLFVKIKCEFVVGVFYLLVCLFAGLCLSGIRMNVKRRREKIGEKIYVTFVLFCYCAFYY